MTQLRRATVQGEVAIFWSDAASKAGGENRKPAIVYRRSIRLEKLSETLNGKQKSSTDTLWRSSMLTCVE